MLNLLYNCSCKKSILGVDFAVGKVKLQAHRGVASECPENTFSAFYRALYQGYDVIELDPEYTLDKKIVILHDGEINRTARNSDGSAIEKSIAVRAITYGEAKAFDFGIARGQKFRGEQIPLFSDVLRFAKREGIRLKLDGKIAEFPEEMLEILLSEAKPCQDVLAITSGSVEFLKKCILKLPDVNIDYDGAVTKETLEELKGLVPKERLTVWLPLKCRETEWVGVPFADEENTALVKQYASLGIWTVYNYEAFYEAMRFSPDIIETDGTVKPEKNAGLRFDMHTHSENSHDSVCPVSEMEKAERAHGMAGFALTDHADIEYCDTIDVDAIAKNAIADISAVCGKIKILYGIEIGEATWRNEAAERLIRENDFDVVVGSVHAVRFPEFSMPYSGIDFKKMGKETAKAYLSAYFSDMEEMVKTCDFDVLAHLSCPLRYINGKFGLGIDLSDYSEKIDEILRLIIERGIALEVNSSCVHPGSGYNAFMPEEWVIKRYLSLGGYLITTGSDAHIAENAANAFDELYALLSRLGVKNTYYYEKRHAVECRLNF